MAHMTYELREASEMAGSVPFHFITSDVSDLLQLLVFVSPKYISRSLYILGGLGGWSLIPPDPLPPDSLIAIDQ